MIKLNELFLMRMKNLLGDEFPLFLSSMEEVMQKGIYVNENKISVKEFQRISPFPLEKIGYDKAGFYTDNSKKGKHPLHLAGAFYSQEPSAMFTVNAINYKGDERVLDMCASPGGKTIQLANKIQNGLIVSNEINSARANILYSNVERMGLKNVIVTNNSPTEIAKAYANSFDVCLVDAPCSAEGMFRRDEKYVQAWNENLPKMCADRQFEILTQADICLKEGGTLIYSTCTYSLEENEEQVKHFLNAYNYKIIKINADFSRGIGLPEAVRLYPHKQKGEGQFVAVMKKMAKNNLQPASPLRLREDKYCTEFLQQNLDIKLNSRVYNDISYNLIDEKFIKPNLRYLSLGVKIGKTEKNQFKPDHFLFSAFGKDFKRKIELDFNSIEAKNYIHGDEIVSNLDDGYLAVLINSCPIGGAKMSKGKFKNHYPKGLRV